MAFTETLGSRTILDGVGKVELTLAGNVYAGDPIGYNSGWVLSASATTIQPLFVAGTNGSTGERIVAYAQAVVKVVTTAANAATAGAKVALTDGGLYTAAGAGLPDVGYVVSVGSDSLTAILAIDPQAAQITVVRS
jgi:hypothetical protein